MSSPLGVVDQELLLSYSQNDTKNDFNATIGIGGSEGYEFTVISIATSVLLGVMTLTTIIGRNIIITHCSFTRLNLKKMGPLQFCLTVFLVIHGNPKQKDLLNSCEGFLKQFHLSTLNHLDKHLDGG
jgi:hypothetical protein